MNVRMKRLISSFLTVVMLISLTPVSAFAEDDGPSWWETIIGTAEEVKDTVTDAAEDAKNTAVDAAETAKDTVVQTAGEVKDTVVETAGNVKDSIADTAENAYDSTMEFISSISLPDFRAGWKKAASFFSTTVASMGGQMYVDDVGKAIAAMEDNINKRAVKGGTIASKAGFVAEEWHSGTYNIDAVAKGVKDKTASALAENGLGSVDVQVNDEVKAGLKYYKNAEESAKAQAKNYVQRYHEYAAGKDNPLSIDEWLDESNVNVSENKELYWSIYKDQVRVIPADQLEDAQKYLKEAIAKEAGKDGPNRQYVKAGYEETLENLSDRISTSDGVSSLPLTKEEAEAIAQAGLDNDMDPAKYGFAKSNVIKGNYVAKQALKGGASAAIIETAVVVGPQLYEIIKYLIDTGEIDAEQIKKTGLDGLTAAADGFLKGSISNALVIMCQAGKLGTAYMNASPEFIGALTVLVIDAIRYGIEMSNGKMSTEAYADLLAQEFLVSAVSLGSAALVGMLFPGATLAICLGSFVGSLVVSAGYPAGKEYVLALIDNAQVDILVPIQANAESLKDKACEMTAKLSDSLEELKFWKKNKNNNITIKVFDFTEII